MYSNSTGCFYCIPCKLFHAGTNSFTNDFNDWKNSRRFEEHEQSLEHRNNTKNFILRIHALNKIDSALNQQYLKEIDYWHKVLQRVVSIIKFLGLPFCGGESNEVFASIKNGNYFGSLELLAEHDNFLKTHIETHGKPGSGKPVICQKRFAMNSLI